MTVEKVQPKQLDIAHIFFLELLRDYKNNLGASLAVRQMNNRAELFAKNLPRQDYETWEQFGEALAAEGTVMNLWETSLERQDMIVATQECPFAMAVDHYTDIMGGVPNEYSEITDEFNRSSVMNQKGRIGQGSACSPFCAIHQPLRRVSGSKIFIANKPVQVIALGSRVGHDIMLAYEFLAEEQIAPEKVKRILEKNVCCFLLKLDQNSGAGGQRQEKKG